MAENWRKIGAGLAATGALFIAGCNDYPSANIVDCTDSSAQKNTRNYYMEDGDVISVPAISKDGLKVEVRVLLENEDFTAIPQNPASPVEDQDAFISENVLFQFQPLVATTVFSKDYSIQITATCIQNSIAS